jgi:hypothetical protein
MLLSDWLVGMPPTQPERPAASNMAGPSTRIVRRSEGVAAPAAGEAVKMCDIVEILVSLALVTG